jgi:hypothetical protein
MTEKKVIIFDWDDTLYYTNAYDDIINSPIDIKEYNEYIDNLLNLLSYAQTKGRVIIVTNGSREWVKNVCCNRYPELKIIFDDLSITLISARDMYSSLYPKQYILWKEFAFKSILDLYIDKNCSDKSLHMLSIGDSNDERTAIWRTINKNIKRSSLKLLKKPTFNLLLYQIKLIKKYWLDLLLDSTIDCDYILDTNYDMIIKNGVINKKEIWIRPVLTLPIVDINDSYSISTNSYNLRKRKRTEI